MAGVYKLYWKEKKNPVQKKKYAKHLSPMAVWCMAGLRNPNRNAYNVICRIVISFL